MPKLFYVCSIYNWHIYRDIYIIKKYEYLFKVNFNFVIVIIFILTMCIFSYLIIRQKKNSYLNAGKKWDRIVNELSRRK